MVNIEFRHYQEGDDEQLADLFNRAFQTLGGGQVKTPKQTNWRYAQSPNFEPEMIQIAEDTDIKKIVGAIYVNMVEYIPLNGKKYLTGDINDVSTHPDYTGQGISKNLMKMAIEYMEKRGCDISMLTADYRGFPRKKIYLKVGYNDYDRELVFIKFANPLKFIRDFKGAAFLFPVLAFSAYIPRFLNRIRIKANPFFKNFSYEICHNRKHFVYTEAANRIISKYFTGYPGYDKEKTIWARVKNPIKRYEPIYILIRKNAKIIGGALLTSENVYAFKYGIKLRVGFIHELFLEKSEFKNVRNLHFGYIFLIDKVLKAANRKSIGLVFYQAPSMDYHLHNGFRGLNFMKFKGGIVMIKIMKDSIKLPKLNKPLYVPTYISFGAP